MQTIAEVVIVGAGPYGLSLAAHLNAKGVHPRIFGVPMANWRHRVPRGMRLKSEGFASSLSDPSGQFTLGTYCRERNLAYADLDLPVAVETFAAYGEAFQRRLVPQLDQREVCRLSRRDDLFSILLDDGSSVLARSVVIAAGLSPYKHIPDELAGLPPDRLSHTADAIDYTGWAGRRVVVVGAGASAIDAAAALHRAGAAVQLISRRREITFHAAKRRRLIDTFLHPQTPLGPGWRKLFCVEAPWLFRLLPARTRSAILRRYLGPAPGWHARADFDGKVEVTASSRVVAARVSGTEVALEVMTPTGRQSVGADHVVAGTGYALDVRRLALLDEEIVGALELVAGSPQLSSRFESSVPGLYFVGTAAALSFGPMLRFVCGAGFAARTVAGRLASRAASSRSARGDRPSVVVARRSVTGPSLPAEGAR